MLYLRYKMEDYCVPKIIPIDDLKNTIQLSELCHNMSEPIFVTKDGCCEMVIMSNETYERNEFLNKVNQKLQEGEADIEAGKTMNGFDSLEEIRRKYDLESDISNSALVFVIINLIFLIGV